ncbi:MAG: YlmC/YmxH family sporulation protein [Ruminococcaceae bacterium]|nr:YlmC/YmxH family sporulation protein [Oscillospiraceae bacterium]
MKLSELVEKEIVNIRNGDVLGYITDLKIDTCSGKICCIYVTEAKNFLTLKSCKCLDIPWSSICKIGKDAILVDFCH